MDSFDRTVMAVIGGIVLAIVAVILLAEYAVGSIAAVTPEQGSSPPATTVIEIKFRQPMQEESVETRFSTEPAIEGEFAWAGPTLVFTPGSPLNPETTYTVTLAANAVSRSGQVIEAFSWSFRPRQARILYLSPAGDIYQDLWLTGLSQPDQPTQVFHAQYGIEDFSPAPDGSQVAVTVTTEEASSNIWVVDADGLHPKMLIECSPGACSNPVWSPDGRWLAYERRESLPDAGLSPSRVWLYALENDATSPVYEDDQVLGFDPVWSMDSQLLAFFDGREGVIRILNIAQGGATLIPSTMGEVGSFSPEGKAMVYMDIRRVGYQFYSQLSLARFGEGQGTGDLLEAPEEDSWPAWSPDGRYIAFARRLLDRTAGPGSQLVLLDYDTGQVQQITDDPRYNNLGFRWEPGGHYLLFTRFDLEVSPAYPGTWVYDTSRPESAPFLLVENGSGGQWLP